MRRNIFAACGLAVFAFQAQAATYTGTAGPMSGEFSLWLDLPPAPNSTDTTWSVSVDLDQPHASFIEFNYFYDYEVYDRETGAWLYGNSAWLTNSHAFQLSSYSDAWTLPASGVSEIGDEIKYTRYGNVSMRLIMVGLDTPVTYSVSTKLAPSAGVPEPTSWAMLICGFGLAGTILRKRRPVVSFGLQPLR